MEGALLTRAGFDIEERPSSASRRSVTPTPRVERVRLWSDMFSMCISAGASLRRVAPPSPRRASKLDCCSVARLTRYEENKEYSVEELVGRGSDPIAYILSWRTPASTVLRVAATGLPRLDALPLELWHKCRLLLLQPLCRHPTKHSPIQSLQRHQPSQLEFPEL